MDSCLTLVFLYDCDGVERWIEECSVALTQIQARSLTRHSMSCLNVVLSVKR